MTAESRRNGKESTGASRTMVISFALHACSHGSGKTGITERKERNSHLSVRYTQWHEGQSRHSKDFTKTQANATDG
jgi:hypothetical protein